MKIQAVIDLAKNGELRNLNLKDDVDAVLGFINLGMIELYKRFPLSTDEYLFERLVGTDIYELPTDFMWIVGAYGTIIKENKLLLSQLGVNEEDSPFSVNTINWHQIQVAPGIAAGQTSIIYVNAPTVYDNTMLNDDIGLPPQMIEPLLHFIGYRAHESIDGSIQGDHNTFYQRFESSCKRIKTEGMFSADDVSMIERIIDRGFA